MKVMKTLSALLVLALIAGCGSKPRMSESIQDIPETHVLQGMRLLDRGDLDNAAYSFNLALSLDRRYAPAMSGFALLELERGDGDEAYRQANDAVRVSDKLALPYAVRARVKSVNRKGDDWLESAKQDFDKALKLSPDNERFLFWLGQAEVAAFEFQAASDLFSQVIAAKGDYAEKADQELKEVQTILRAAPGTRLGNRIALMKRITQADLAVLFLEELKLQEVYDRKTPKNYDVGFQPPAEHRGDAEMAGSAFPPDIVDHWARTWILQVIEMGVMEAGPDGNFYPDSEVNRATYAMLLQHILVTLMNEPELETKYLGEESRFKDMSSTSVFYNAAALSVDRGVMFASVDGTFRPLDSVSGADALLIIRQLQNYLRMTF